MNQEDINEVQWKSLPQWRKDQLIEEAAHDEDIKRVGNKNPTQPEPGTTKENRK